MEVLGNPSKEFLQLVSDIAEGKSEDYEALLKINPQLLSEQDKRGKTPVHYALGMLTSSKGPSALKFLNYIFTPEHKELSNFFPLSLADDKGNLPVHLIAKQLMQLDDNQKNHKGTRFDQNFYEGGLLLAANITSSNPYLLQIPNIARQTPLHFLLLNTSNDKISSIFFSDDFAIDRHCIAYKDILNQLPWLFDSTNLRAYRANRRKTNRLEKESKVIVLLKNIKQIEPSQLHATLAKQENKDLLNFQDLTGETLLFKAVYANNRPLIDALMAAGAKPNVANLAGIAPVHIAAGFKHSSAVLKQLIIHGAHINVPSRNGQYPLHLAVKSDPVAVDTLIEQGAHINARDNDGNTPLHEAAVNAELGVLKLLIDARADINVANHQGRTPLHVVAALHELWNKSKKASRAISLLRKAGAHINATDHEGQTAVHLAVQSASLYALEALIEACADVNAANHDGQTPLHLAAQLGAQGRSTKYLNSKIKTAICLLSKAGAHLDATDHKGQTAVHLAVQSSSLAALKALIDAGADLCIVDKSGHSASQLAQSTNDIHIMKTLAEHAGGTSSSVPRE
jgi:ankyrin repeat protein